MQADTRTTASPDRTTTAPFACFAIFPVSRVSLQLPRSTSTVCCIFFLKTSHTAPVRAAACQDRRYSDAVESGVDRDHHAAGSRIASADEPVEWIGSPAIRLERAIPGMD